MTDDTGYNGWANYPTWNVALWINNDQGWQESVRDALRDAREGYALDNDEAADGTYASRPWLAGEVIRNNVEEFIYGPEGEVSGIAADLIGWALDSVDWSELGASFLADLDES